MEEKNKKIKKSKKKIIITTSITTLLLVLIVGITYAVWNYSFIGNRNVIETGEVSIEFLESNDVIAIENAIPLTDEEGEKQFESFEFQVTTKSGAGISLKYDLNIEKVNGPEGYTSLEDNEVKVYLTDENDNPLVGPTLISNLSNYNLYSKVNSHTENSLEIQNRYKIRVWIDEGVEDSYDWSTQNNLYYNFKIGVTSSEYDPVGSEALISKVWSDGLEKISHTGDSTLQSPFDQDTEEYRYRGSNPENYVSFNNELWRIIGVFPVDDGTGNIENRIKIIRNESIGVMAWNDCVSSDGNVCDDTGKLTNNWEYASLNTYLNGEYYNSLTLDAQNMVGSSKYYLGSAIYRLMIAANASERYKFERKISGSDYYYGDNPNSVVSKIGIMYVSDYMYAATGCDDKTGYVSSGDDIRLCKDDNFLYLNIYEWTIMPYGKTTDDLWNALYVNGVHAYITNHRVHDITTADVNVRPVLYLLPNVKITSGDGTIDNPYVLGI